MSSNYRVAAEDVRRFLVRISTETNALNAKIIAYGDRLGRITKVGHPGEWNAVMRESAADFESFADRIDALLPEYRHDIGLLTEGFTETVAALEKGTDRDARKLEDMRREALALAQTARWDKAQATLLRTELTRVRESNYDPRLTQSAQRVITTVTDLVLAFEDLETFALKVSFSAEQK